MAVLGSFVLLFLLFSLVVCYLWRSTDKKLRNQLTNLTKVSIKQVNHNNCYCCTKDRVQTNSEGTDGKEEGIGFTEELAQSYVDHLETSIKFAEENSKIVQVLKVRRHVIKLAESSGVGEYPPTTLEMNGSGVKQEEVKVDMENQS